MYHVQHLQMAMKAQHHENLVEISIQWRNERRKWRTNDNGNNGNGEKWRGGIAKWHQREMTKASEMA